MEQENLKQFGPSSTPRMFAQVGQNINIFSFHDMMQFPWKFVTYKFCFVYVGEKTLNSKIKHESIVAPSLWIYSREHTTQIVTTVTAPLTAAPLTFQAKTHLLCVFYVVIQTQK